MIVASIRLEPTRYASGITTGCRGTIKEADAGCRPKGFLAFRGPTLSRNLRDAQYTMPVLRNAKDQRGKWLMRSRRRCRTWTSGQSFDIAVDVRIDAAKIDAATGR
jgi:hypothetical protein